MVREFSAGGVVYQNKDRETLWLIRRPAANPDFTGNLGWNFPRGLIDAAEPLEKAARREVAEEAGVEARVVAKLPTFKIFYTDKKTGEKKMKFITFFLMERTADSPSGFGWETAETKWVTVEEAEKLLVFDNEKKILREAAQMLKSQGKDGGFA